MWKVSHLLRKVVRSNDIAAGLYGCCVELVRLKNLLGGVCGLGWVQHNARAKLRSCSWGCDSKGTTLVSNKLLIVFSFRFCYFSRARPASVSKPRLALGLPQHISD